MEVCKQLIGPQQSLRHRKWGTLLLEQGRQVSTRDVFHHQKLAVGRIAEMIRDLRQPGVIEIGYSNPIGVVKVAYPSAGD